MEADATGSSGSTVIDPVSLLGLGSGPGALKRKKITGRYMRLSRQLMEVSGW